MPEAVFGPDQLHAWRERMSLNSRDAAEALGCSRGALLGWEAGRVPVPKYIALACAALALGIDPYKMPKAPR